MNASADETAATTPRAAAEPVLTAELPLNGTPVTLETTAPGQQPIFRFSF